MVWSPPHVAKSLPFGLHVTHHTRSVCPESSCKHVMCGVVMNNFICLFFSGNLNVKTFYCTGLYVSTGLDNGQLGSKLRKLPLKKTYSKVGKRKEEVASPGVKVLRGLLDQVHWRAEEGI